MSAMSHLLQANAARREEIAGTLSLALAEEPLVMYAYLHGSFLSQPRFHDVDVAVYLTDDATPGSRLPLDLSGRLTARLGVPVDVRALNHAPLSFRFHAMRGRLLLSRDDDRLAQMIEDTTRRYLDIEPVLRIATRDAFAP